MARKGEFGIREGGLPGPEEEFEEEERLKGGPYRKKLKEAASKEPTPEEALFRNEEMPEEIVNPDDNGETETPIATLRSGKTEQTILRGEEPYDNPDDLFHEIKSIKPNLSPLRSRNPDLEKLPKQKPISAEPFGWDARKFTKKPKKRGKEKRK